MIRTAASIIQVDPQVHLDRSEHFALSSASKSRLPRRVHGTQYAYDGAVCQPPRCASTTGYYVLGAFFGGVSRYNCIQAKKVSFLSVRSH